MENTEYEYWLTEYPQTCDALASVISCDISTIANDLAITAGDYADMPDEEVLATFLNDNLDPGVGKRDD